MKNDEIKGVGAVDAVINREREAMGRAFTNVLNLLMQCISICVATRDPETLATLEQEVSTLFEDAHSMLAERTPAVKAGLN